MLLTNSELHSPPVHCWFDTACFASRMQADTRGAFIASQHPAAVACEAQPIGQGHLQQLNRGLQASGAIAPIADVHCPLEDAAGNRLRLQAASVALPPARTQMWISWHVFEKDCSTALAQPEVVDWRRVLHETDQTPDCKFQQQCAVAVSTTASMA